MTTHATGSFEVKMTPQSPSNESGIGVMDLDKMFHGDLEATSRGYMLATQTAVEGSAGYVAIERVSGVLNGREGSFALQHSGIMNKGAPSLTITIIPDSGTDQLEGISGSMIIHNDDGKHTYEFDYLLTSA